MTTDELTPDMIWRQCPDCEKNYTLADTDDGSCPHCGSFGNFTNN